MLGMGSQVPGIEGPNEDEVFAVAQDMPAVLSAEIRHLRRTLNPTQEAPSQSTTNNQRTA